MTEIGKIPPQSIDLEEILLGALMLEPDAFYEVSNILKSEMFYKDANQKIYNAIYELSDDFKPIDALTVTELLRKKGLLDQCGGVFHITQLTSKISTAANIEEYALIINQKYLAREGIRISTEITSKCFDEFEDINDILDYAYQNYDKLNDSTIHGRTKSFEENIQNALDKYEQRVINKEKGLQAYYTTGLGKLNKILIGWKPGDLTILAARPSIGKTALSLFFAKSAAYHNISVDIFSLEMIAQQITDRMILGETNINPSMYQSGYKVDWNQLEKATAKISTYNISINDEMDISINYIRSIIRKKYKQNTLGLVVIDYLQLMEGTDKSNKNNEVGSITRALKKLCVKYKLPIILLSQLSRDFEKRGSKKHKLSDLRDSGNIEQDADNVIFITRERYDTEDNELDYTDEENRKIFIDVAKHRSGALGVIQCYCNEYVNNFYEKTEHKDYEDYTERKEAF